MPPRQVDSPFATTNLNSPTTHGSPNDFHNPSPSPSPSANHQHEPQVTGYFPTPRRTDGKQWAEQSPDQIPKYDKATNKYIGHFADNCCKSPPCKSDLQNLQPGNDGSTLDPLCSSKAFTHGELEGEKGQILQDVANWITMELAQKLQHTIPIAAWVNRVISAICSPLSRPSDEKSEALLKHAETYNKAIAFLGRMGGNVSIVFHLGINIINYMSSCK